MFKKHLLQLGLLLRISTPNAYATLIGSTVNLSAYYPETYSLYADGGNATVSDTLEYHKGFIYPYNSGFSADITDSQLMIIFPNNTSFSIAGFNGFVLDIISGPDILGATIDSLSSFDPIDITIAEGGSRLFLNYSGVSPVSGSSIINLVTSATSVPEPSLLSLLTLGLLGLTLSKRITIRPT